MGRGRLPSFTSSYRPPRSSYPAGASAEERAVREKGNKQHWRGLELVPLTDP